MALRDEIVSVLLNIVYNKQTGDAANKGLDKTRAAIDSVTKAAKGTTAAAPDMGKAIEKSSAQATDSVLRLKDAYDAVGKSAANAGKASGGGNTLGAVGNIGQVGSRALGAVGLGDVGQALNSIGDLADLGQITDDIQGLVKNIAPLQGIAEGLTPALGASGAAFASLGLVIAPIAAVILGVALVMKSLQDSAERATKAQQDLIDASNKAADINFKIKQDAQNKTKEQLATEYDNVKAEYDLAQQKLDAARARKAALDKEFANLGSSFNPQARSDIGAKGVAEQENIKALETQLAGLTDALTVASGAMQDTTQATKEAAAADTEAALAHLATIQENQRMQAQLDELAATGTSKQVAAMKDANDRQITNLQAYQKAAIEYAQTLKQGSEENRLASDQAAAYGHQIEVLTQQNQQLTDSTLPIIEAREKEAAAAAYQQKQFEETAAAVKGYNADVAKLNDSIQASKDKLVETMDGIFEQAQKAAQSALDKLTARRNDIAQSFARDEQKAERDRQTKIIDIQIAAQRAEVDAYKNYRRKLRDIQKDADEQAFELALNRDFSGLFNLNRNTESAKNQAAQEEADAIEDVRQARQENLADLARNIEIERQERQIQLQQNIADAVAAYQTERAQIDAQRNEALAKAKAAAAREQQLLQQQLDTRAQAIRAELQLIQQGEQTRLQITNAAMQALVAQAQQLLAAFSGGGDGYTAGGGGGNQGRALGGGLAAFNRSKVNELPGQRERFSTGGRSYALPGGAGMFTPFKSGTVNPNGGGGGGQFTFNQTNNISGSNLDGIADLIDKRTKTIIRKVAGLD